MSDSTKDVYDPSHFFGPFGRFVNILDPDFLGQYQDVWTRARKLLDENEDILKRLRDDEKFVKIFETNPQMRIFRSGNITAEDLSTSLRAILCGTKACTDPPIPLGIYCRGCFGRMQAVNERTGAIEIESFDSNKSEVGVRKKHTKADKDLHVVDTSAAEQSDEEELMEEEGADCYVMEEEGDPEGAVERTPKRHKKEQTLHGQTTDSEDNELMFDATPPQLPLEVQIGGLDNIVVRPMGPRSGKGRAAVFGNAKSTLTAPGNVNPSDSRLSPLSSNSSTSSWVPPQSTPYPHLMLQPESEDSDEINSMPRFTALNERLANTGNVRLHDKQKGSVGKGRSIGASFRDEEDDDDGLPSTGNIADYVFGKSSIPTFQLPSIPPPSELHRAVRKRKARPLVIDDEETEMCTGNDHEQVTIIQPMSEEKDEMEVDPSQQLRVPESQLSNSSGLDDTLLELQAIGSDGY